jgi:hypothetical protein
MKKVLFVFFAAALAVASCKQAEAPAVEAPVEAAPVEAPAAVDTAAAPAVADTATTAPAAH